MASQQPNAWHTASGRSRATAPASRTPQSRSNTQSPSQQTTSSQPPRQDGGRALQQQPNNVWTQRSSSAGGSNGPMKVEPPTSQEDAYQPVNGFNSDEVNKFLCRDMAELVAYKPTETGGARNSGGPWATKAGTMANGQPFFVQLAKQIATVEGGG